MYAVTRRLLSLPGLLLRRSVSKEAELLVLRHQNAVLCRQVSRVRYEPADRLWPAALSRLIPRFRLGGDHSPTPARTSSRAPQAPKANAHGERSIGTLRRELLDSTLILNEHHLRRTLTRYLAHYNTARPHRGIGQLSPSQAETGPPSPIDLADHGVHRKAILGGLINEYRVASRWSDG
ncbi:integrase core domain-containing protein [Nonomuraea sp. NPDC049714]|uniref:integrase core domain-containing protein n=1 Tax=Nonomuraea sp. NPDC049714 TaxID=3364357 RepID=UPI0037A88399